MSTTVPYSQAARGRIPIGPVVRWGIVFTGIATSVAVLTWVMTTSAPKQEEGHATWNPGTPLKSTLVPQQAPKPAVAPVPAPASAAAQDTAGSGVRVMMSWGGAALPSVPSYGAHAVPGLGGGGASGPAGTTEGSDKTDLASRLTPTKTKMGEATTFDDISLMLAEGTKFSCLLQEPIDTQLLGKISCIVDEPGGVRSADGSNILIDPGARVIGEIQHGIQHGQDRAFVLWTNVQSKRVYAQLNSPGTDMLGQTGVPGVVDEHWWQRIKGAVMLTAVDTASSVAQNLASSGANVNLSTGQSMAQTALQRDINIPSTLFVQRGQDVMVQVDHPIQFKKSYNDVLLAGVN